jgi:hypothetical protein
MPAVLNPYLTAGMALAGAGLVAVTPIGRVAQLPEPHVASPDVALTSGGVDFSDLLNVPVNLFNDMMNIPYNLFEAPYSVKGMIPNFVNEDGASGQHVPGTALAADPDNPINDPAQAWPEYHDFDGNPDGDTFHGALNFLSAALDYTGSFYVSNPTNVFGWDTGNTWNLPAALDALLPFTRLGPDMDDNPIGDNINTIAEAEFPEASADNAYFFKDLLGELQTLFTVPFSKLVDGYDLPADGALNPVGVGNDALGNGGLPYHDLWSGQHVTVDPTLGFDKYFEHLLDDPADNPIHPLDPSTILPTIGHAQQAINIDFNPLSAGEDSFIFAAAKDLYGLPDIINGIFNGEHGLDPGGPDLIPDSFTQAVGGFLDDIIGPDSPLAQLLIAIDKPFDAFVNSLSDFTPYDTLNDPLPDADVPDADVAVPDLDPF